VAAFLLGDEVAHCQLWAVWVMLLGLR